MFLTVGFSDFTIMHKCECDRHAMYEVNYIIQIMACPLYYMYTGQVQMYIVC